jgi:Fic family protein
MIVNNFAAMNYVRQVHQERLSPALVLEVHELVTDQTLDPSHTGRLQGPDEDRVVVSDMEGTVLHTPPPADQLDYRLELMCQFANGQVGVEGFMHPVMRAILLHFWLAYDHPFVDGNGRTARVLFYWSMLSQGYWMTEFLSISQVLRAAPAQYARAFLHTETDDNDTTYFVLYQLEVICRAIDGLFEYLGRKMREVREVDKLIRQSSAFNHRQLALLSHALRHPDASYTFDSHARSHHVVYQSGRTDLLDLEQRGLLSARKIGRRFVFSPVPGIAERLSSA